MESRCSETQKNDAILTIHGTHIHRSFIEHRAAITRQQLLQFPLLRSSADLGRSTSRDYDAITPTDAGSTRRREYRLHIPRNGDNRRSYALVTRLDDHTPLAPTLPTLVRTRDSSSTSKRREKRDARSLPSDRYGMRDDLKVAAKFGASRRGPCSQLNARATAFPPLGTVYTSAARALDDAYYRTRLRSY